MSEGRSAPPAPAVSEAPAPRPSLLARLRAGDPPTLARPVVVFGEHIQLLGETFAGLGRRPFRGRLFLEQMEFIGVGSLPIIVLVGFFTGAVAALQAVYALRMFGQERWAGFGVGVALASDLAPVFSALMITARAGSGMATELGSMRVTEQIDALVTFAVNPVQYLITPRVMASILMLPVMTMVFNGVGLFGGYMVTVVQFHVDFGQLAALYQHWIDPIDYIKGLIKAGVFGLALSLASCYQGYFVRGGAKEVGRATTRAVVTGSVAVLILDYFLIEVLTTIWPFRK